MVNCPIERLRKISKSSSVLASRHNHRYPNHEEGDDFSPAPHGRNLRIHFSHRCTYHDTGKSEEIKGASFQRMEGDWDQFLKF